MKVKVSTTIASPPYEMAAFTSDAPQRKQLHTDALATSLTVATASRPVRRTMCDARHRRASLNESGQCSSIFRIRRSSSGASGNRVFRPGSDGQSCGHQAGGADALACLRFAVIAAEQVFDLDDLRADRALLKYEHLFRGVITDGDALDLEIYRLRII